MVNYPNTQIYLGGRGASPDILQLTSYQCEDILVTLTKTDAAGGGQIWAGGQILKPFTMPYQFSHNDQAVTWYAWQPPDLLTVAHEGHGTLMTIGGTGTGIVPANAGAARYAAQFGMLHPMNSAMLAGGCTLQAAENVALIWAVEFWIIRVLSTLGSTIYFETNAGNSQFLQLALSAAGLITITHNGTLAWTAPAAIPSGAWHHVMLVYNPGTNTVQQFVDGVSSGAATAYTRVSGWVGTSTYWNFNANGQFYMALGATYQGFLFGADDALRHFTDLTSDLYTVAPTSTPATLAKGAGVSVLFSNQQGIGYDSGSSVIRLPLYPICLIETFGGIYLVDISVRQKESE